MPHETAEEVLLRLLRAGRRKHPCLVTGPWGIALIPLGCPVILGALLMVLSVLEDSLSESAAPAVTSSTAESRGATSKPNSTPGSRSVGVAAVAEGAHL